MREAPARTIALRERIAGLGPGLVRRWALRHPMASTGRCAPPTEGAMHRVCDLEALWFPLTDASDGVEPVFVVIGVTVEN